VAVDSAPAPVIIQPEAERDQARISSETALSALLSLENGLKPYQGFGHDPEKDAFWR